MSDKLKHISGLYVNLPQSPETDDLEFYIKSKNKKVVNTDDLLKIFGEEKSNKIDAAIVNLMDAGKLAVVELGKYREI